MKRVVEAHGPVLYRNKVWSFGGAKDLQACVYSCAEDRWDVLPPFEQDHGGSYAVKINFKFWLHGPNLDTIYTFDPETQNYGKLDVGGLKVGVQKLIIHTRDSCFMLYHNAAGPEIT